jgi:hypothetical protein
LQRLAQDYLRVTIAISVTAADLAQALNIAWWTFRSSPQPMTSPDGTWTALRRKSGPNGREPKESARPAPSPSVTTWKSIDLQHDHR